MSGNVPPISPSFIEDFLRSGLRAERGILNEVYRKLLLNPRQAPRFDLLRDVLDEESLPTGAVADCELCGVIIESRQHPLLETVVLEVIKMLNIPVQVFHGASTGAFIRKTKIDDLVREGKVRLVPLLTDVLPPHLYNTIVLSRAFWGSLIGRKKVLFFQTDTVLCGNTQYPLRNFMDFDYIGSKRPLLRPFGTKAPGGNGGLSLRDWTWSVECLSRFDADKWVAAEDAFFGFHLSLIGGKVASQDDCAKFGSQDEYLFDSFGAHNLRGMPEHQLGRFLEYCPEARRLL